MSASDIIEVDMAESYSISKIIITTVHFQKGHQTELLFVSIHQGPTIGIFYRPSSSTVSVMDTLSSLNIGLCLILSL